MPMYVHVHVYVHVCVCVCVCASVYRVGVYGCMSVVYVRVGMRCVYYAQPWVGGWLVTARS